MKKVKIKISMSFIIELIVDVLLCSLITLFSFGLLGHIYYNRIGNTIIKHSNSDELGYHVTYNRSWTDYLITYYLPTLMIMVFILSTNALPLTPQTLQLFPFLTNLPAYSNAMYNFIFSIISMGLLGLTIVLRIKFVLEGISIQKIVLSPVIEEETSVINGRDVSKTVRK